MLSKCISLDLQKCKQLFAIFNEKFYRKTCGLKLRIYDTGVVHSQEGFEEAFNTFYTQICKNYKG